MIEITSETIERVQAVLAGVPKEAERALSNAMNRGLSRVKTTAMQNVKRVYAVQSSALSAATNTKMQKASTGNLAGFVSFSGCKIPLYKFKVTPKQPGTGKTVRAAVMKGGGTAFEDAFIAGMGSGHLGVFERTGRPRLPIEEFMALSAAQMVGNEGVITEVEQQAQQLVEERLDHEIERLLSQYGG